MFVFLSISYNTLKHHSVQCYSYQLVNLRSTHKLVLKEIHRLRLIASSLAHLVIDCMVRVSRPVRALVNGPMNEALLALVSILFHRQPKLIMRNLTNVSHYKTLHWGFTHFSKILEYCYYCRNKVYLPSVHLVLVCCVHFERD